MATTDVYHITVAGINPHDLVSEMQEEDNPFYDDVMKAGVAQHIIENNILVGGIVEIWNGEHLTPAQEQYLADNPNVIDVRHIYPE